MKQYLYGAAIQGIQGFIFQTEDLRHIAGASELIEQICKEYFSDLFDKQMEKQRIISAAGNIRYILNEEECRKAVREFPKMVMTKVPGITVSQAVVEYNEESDDFGSIVNIMEQKLKIQRNHPTTPLSAGILGMERSRQTGLPIVHNRYSSKNTPLDASSQAKEEAANLSGLCKKSFYGYDSEVKLKPQRIPYDIEAMTGNNDWIAIIHADGNSLGQVVQTIGHNKEKYKAFSDNLDKATIAAANSAFESIATDIRENGIIPIRPVVLGGDDMTVIIRGDLALDYLQVYLKKFEEYSGKYLDGLLDGVFKDGTKHLTACAGIAFIKSSYPFHYGYKLAEDLCGEAKKAAKREMNEGGKINSCIMFHKVQDSFVSSYSDIVQRELSPKGKPYSSLPAINYSKTADTDERLSLKFGPYFIFEEDATDNRMTIDNLLDCVKALGENEGIHSTIRQWLSSLHEGYGQSRQMIDRLLQVHPESKDLIYRLTRPHIRTITDSEGCQVSEYSIPAQDCLSMYTIKNQQTK